jgi:hypothetical protein
MKTLLLCLLLGLVGCKESAAPSARTAETDAAPVEPEFESVIDPLQFVGLAFEHQPSGYKFKIEKDGANYIAKAVTPDGKTQHCYIAWDAPSDQSQLTIDLRTCYERSAVNPSTLINFIAWDYGQITFRKKGSDLMECEFEGLRIITTTCEVVLKAIDPAELDGWAL